MGLHPYQEGLRSVGAIVKSQAPTLIVKSQAPTGEYLIPILQGIGIFFQKDISLKGIIIQKKYYFKKILCECVPGTSTDVFAASEGFYPVIKYLDIFSYFPGSGSWRIGTVSG
jgi:hypothetical protein